MTQNEDARTETIENWLIINWKEGNTRTRKGEPDQRKLGTHEIATRLQIDVVIPEVEIPELAARVEVPGPQVETAVLDDLDEEDLPDWKSVADDVLRDRLGDDGADIEDLKDAMSDMVVQTLQDAPGRPDVDDVEGYLARKGKAVLRGDA